MTKSRNYPTLACTINSLSLPSPSITLSATLVLLSINLSPLLILPFLPHEHSLPSSHPAITQDMFFNRATCKITPRLYSNLSPPPSLSITHHHLAHSPYLSPLGISTRNRSVTCSIIHTLGQMSLHLSSHDKKTHFTFRSSVNWIRSSFRKLFCESL